MTLTADYARKWLVDGSGDDGFIERFQLLVFPDFSENWTYVDELPDNRARDKFARTLLQIVDGLSGEHPVVFRFAPRAQQSFKQWLTELEHKMRSTDISPRMQSHLGKFRSLMPSLACLYELAEMAYRGFFEGFEGEHLIHLECAEAAVRWCSYLESHANRIYSLVDSDIEPVQILARHISNRKLGSVFTMRDIKQKEWKGLKKDKAIEEAIDALISKSWLRVADNKSSLAAGQQFDITSTRRFADSSTEETEQ